MRSTRELDYAVMSMAFLAGDRSGRPVVRREIAARLGLPEDFLAKVLGKLNRAGLIRSFQGARGGYRLGRPADAISLADIVRAIDGPVRMFCSLEDRGGCEGFCLCEAAEAVRRAQEGMMNALDAVPLARMTGGTGHDAPQAARTGR